MSSFRENNNIPIESVEIAFIYEAPDCLQGAIIPAALSVEISISNILEAICRTALFQEDGNWNYDPILRECREKLRDFKWYQYYELIQRMSQQLLKNYDQRYQPFIARFNVFFIENGIGWQIAEDTGFVVRRGDSDFEHAIETATEDLLSIGLSKTVSDFKNARMCLSKWPDPDTKGAVGHAVGALEAYCEKITGLKQLGPAAKVLNKQEKIDSITLALIDKVYGFASDKQRHRREGQELSYSDAEWVVTVASSTISMLKAKLEE